MAVGTVRSANGLSIGVDGLEEPDDYKYYGERSSFEKSGREPDYPQRLFPAKKLTPIQDSLGIITPAPLHFVSNHYVPPNIDPRQHRLLIHGMVDRPLIYSLEELKRLPSVNRIHFLECNANGVPMAHRGRTVLDTAQDIYGRTSCSEWTGVPLSVLLKEAGVQRGASWLVSDGADSGHYSYSLPLAKAMDDVLVAYGQNGEAVRPEQGYPLRLLVPGFEAPYSVKWLRQIKVVDQPYLTKNHAFLHAYLRPDLGGKARWFYFQMPPRALILRPSGGQQLPGRGYYEINGLAWSGGGAVRKVEVSTDRGRKWQEAQLQEPVLRMAHTRFRLGWTWDGEETVLLARCTDDQGEIQPTLEQLDRSWGINDKEYWHSTSETPYHFNAIQPWRVSRDGSVHNAMFS
jgi:sulfane dehydrogenase subunit SoxC